VWAPTLPVTVGHDVDVAAFADGGAFAFDRGDNYIHASQDHGMTWLRREIPASRNGSVFDMASSTRGYFFSQGAGLYETRDGARSWDQTEDLPLPGPNFFEQFRTGEGWSYSVTAMARSRTGGLMAMGGDVHYFENHGADCLGPNARAAVWTKTGKEWRLTKLPHPGKVRDLAFLSDRVGLVLALKWGPATGSSDFTCESRESIVYLTTDGGRTFRPVIRRSFEQPAQAFTSIGIASRATFVAGTADGSTVLTTDGGRSFHDGQALVNPAISSDGAPYDGFFWISGFDFADRSVGYASTKGGGTWRTEDGARTWTLEASTELVFSRTGFGDVAAADREHAISAGGTSVLTRLGP